MAKTILAVDDSGSLRQMVVFSLRAAGYQVTEAVDGQDGLDKARNQEFDLVLTDQNMPRMDGLSLIRSLRGLPTYQKVPLLMLTTESSDEMKSKGRAAGANGWLVKPFDPQRLTEENKKENGKHDNLQLSASCGAKRIESNNNQRQETEQTREQRRDRRTPRRNGKTAPGDRHRNAR